MSEKLYSVAEVAARYGLSRAWVYRCQDLKRIAFKVGKYLRWRESDLIAMEEYRRLQPRGHRLHHRASVMRHSSNTDALARARKKLLFDMN